MDAAAETAVEILREAAVLLAGNAPWMAWNLLLAMIPLWLAAHLFRRSNGRAGGIVWWFGVVMFFAFLPNAPYVLTDLIHLPRDIADATTSWRMAFVVVPQYVLFCAAGFLSYVVSLIWLVRMLRIRGWSRRALTGVELGVHLLYWPTKHVVIAAATYVRSGSIRNSHGLIERYL